MMSWPNVNCSSRKYGILIIASILLFLIIIIGSSVALVSLMSADEIQYDKAIQSTYNDFYSLGNIANRGIHTTMFIYKSTDTSSMML